LAHIKSAKKRIRQNEKRRLRNQAVKTRFRNLIKECRLAISAGKKEEAEQVFKKTKSAIARAVSKGVIHKNTGSRYISRLNQLLNRVSQKSQ